MAYAEQNITAAVTTVGGNFNIATENATATVGAWTEDLNGRRFRYCKNSSTAITTPGVFMQGAAFNTTEYNLAIPTSSVAGAKTVYVTTGSAYTANEYKGAIFFVNDNTGQGEQHVIESHAAASSGATATLVLETPMVAALTAATDQAGVIKLNVFDGTVIAVHTAPTSVLIGVATCAVPASYYFWAQTRGVCVCLCGTTVGSQLGQGIEMSNSAAGAWEAHDTSGATDFASCGQIIQHVGVDTEYKPIWVDTGL